MLQLCLFAILISIAISSPVINKMDVENKNCGWPNGTDTKFYAYNCDTTYVIQVKDQAVYDNDTRQPMYPVDVNRKILIELKAQNNGDVYKDNKVDVELYEYAYSWLHGLCDWSKIPTLGLLNNIDGCEVAHNCPLQKGALNLDLPLDLTKYSSIIKILAGNKPYQLVINMFDGDHKKKIACVVAQLRFAT